MTSENQIIEAEYTHAPQQTTAVATTHDLSLTEIKNQVNTIQHVMREVMKPDEHYGTIPGCGPKPTLLQPGAQKLALTFQFAPIYQVHQTDQKGGHREYQVTTRLQGRQNGQFIGEGVGVCSTREGKFLYRTVKTPTGQPIPADAKENKGAYRAQGFVMSKENNQWVWCKIEKIEHDNPADYYNTAIKMAKKRAYVDAVLTATAASDIFTQDIEEDPELYGGHAPAQQQPSPPKQSAPQPSPRQPVATPAAPQQAPPQPLKQPQPQADANHGKGVYHVEAVNEVKRGERNGNEWILSEIVTTEGDKFKTFKDEQCQTAIDAREADTPVNIEWSANKYGKNAEDVTDASPGSVTDPDLEMPSFEDPETAETAIATITKVEQFNAKAPNGTMSVLYRIFTDDSQVRYGTDNAEMADMARDCAANNMPAKVEFFTSRRGRELTNITPNPQTQGY